MIKTSDILFYGTFVLIISLIVYFDNELKGLQSVFALWQVLIVCGFAFILTYNYYKWLDIKFGGKK